MVFPYKTNRHQELMSLDHKAGADWNQNLNSLPDNAKFWRVLNAPTQKVSFRPIAGQEILIKRMELRKLKESAAKKTTRTLDLTAPFIPAVVDPRVSGRRILSVDSYIMVPTVRETKEDRYCGNLFSSQSSSGDGPYVLTTRKVAYEKVKIETPAYLFNRLGLDARDLGFAKGPVELTIGQTYHGPKKCDKEGYKTMTKSYPHKYQVR